MNEFELDWISFNQSFVQNGWIQDGRIKDGHHHQVESEWMSEVFFVQNGWMQEGRIQDGCHYQVEWERMSLSQIELVWVRVLCKMVESKMAEFKMGGHHEVEWEWMSLSQIELVSIRVLCKMVESKIAELKMATIIKLSQNEWVKFFCAKWLNARRQNSSWLPSSSWVGMNEFESDWISFNQSFVPNGWIKDDRIQDGCHHEVEWEWMSLSQIELVWVRVKVEWECFWVNQREDNKVSESKMAVSEFNMSEFKMAAIIKLSQNEWVKIFCANGGEGNVSKVFFVQMVATILGKCEWVWEVKLRWLNPRWPNWRRLPSSSWIRMKEFESDWIGLSQSFVQNGWIQDGRIKDGHHHQIESEWMSLSQFELVWCRVRVEWEGF